ncbi:malonyl CoA-acyl carrier protein transacylase [Clostridia bacterium]|nr:malonyl CoA-acyl carrier protein transacylase [Clostridia bacterium]
MSTAWVFAGQGSQTPDMGRDFYDAYPEVREIFDSKAAGFNLLDMCSNAEQLSQTRYTQPCMAAFAAAVVRILRGLGYAPDYTAGLSLGEYSALHAAGVLDADTLLDLLAFRGVAMEDAAAGIESRMTAVLGLTEQQVRGAVGDAAVTNVNCPGQVVIGGELAAVLEAEKRCTELGARRCMPLNTSGPFHTPLMEPASVKLREKLSSLELSPQQVPVIFNATGDTAGDGEVKELLCTQVKSTVLFEASIRRMAALGVDRVVEIGPGNVLAGFVRKTAPDIKVVSINKVEDLKLLEGLWD